MSGLVVSELKFKHPGGINMQFDFHQSEGTVTAVIGPSGAGKSTLLDLIAGFAMPSSGSITFNDQDITTNTPSNRPLSIVFQDSNLFSHLTVFRNIALGRSPKLKLTDRDHHDIRQALAEVELADKADRLPEQLSGGEKQRVALARVLVRAQPLLLLDEAFSSLGPALRMDMLKLVRELQQHLKLTVLMVTHHPEDARGFADHILFLNNGKIEAAGSPDELLSNPTNTVLRSYLEPGSQSNT